MKTKREMQIFTEERFIELYPVLKFTMGQSIPVSCRFIFSSLNKLMTQNIICENGYAYGKCPLDENSDLFCVLSLKTDQKRHRNFCFYYYDFKDGETIVRVQELLGPVGKVTHKRQSGPCVCAHVLNLQRKHATVRSGGIDSY